MLYAERLREQDYCGMEILIAVLLHRLDDGDWRDDELMPIQAFEIIPWTQTGHPCGVKVVLKDGREYTIDYGHVDGRRII